MRRSTCSSWWSARSARSSANSTRTSTISPTLVLDAWLRTSEEARATAFAALEEQLVAARQQYDGAKALDEALFGNELDAA